MFMVIDYCVKNKYFDSFVIEEPELNLYPTNQRELLHFVLQRFNNANEKDSINVILTQVGRNLKSLDDYCCLITKALSQK